MLLVNCILKESPLHGIGLFAAEDIKKGTLFWRYNPKIDIYFDPKDLEKSDQLIKNVIEEYAYLSKRSFKYVYSIDNMRFVNHSTNPNLMEVYNKNYSENDTVSKRDIKKGEEILTNYKMLDLNCEISKEKYLNS